MGAAYVERRFGSMVDETLTGVLGHFRPVMRNFYYFRVGVFGGPEVAGRVVGALAWPEVGAAYEKSAEAPFSVTEGAAGGGREDDRHVAGSKRVRLRESAALWDERFGNGGRWRKNRKFASTGRPVWKRTFSLELKVPLKVPERPGFKNPHLTESFGRGRCGCMGSKNASGRRRGLSLMCSVSPLKISLWAMSEGWYTDCVGCRGENDVSASVCTLVGLHHCR